MNLIERLKYWHWKNWYLAGLSPRTRFIGELRIMTVYNPTFKKSGLIEVKKIHIEHIEKLRRELSALNHHRQGEGTL